MKKLSIITAALLLAVLSLLPAKSFAAGDSFPIIDFTALPKSSVADGKSKITFTVHAYFNICSEKSPEGYTYTGDSSHWCEDNGHGTTTVEGFSLGSSSGTTPITVTGSGNTLSETVLSGNDTQGLYQFTLTSTVAETKTVTLNNSYVGNTTTTVTFTTPKPATPAAPATPAPDPTPAPPASPTVSTVTIAGVSADTTKPITLASNKLLVLAGPSVPNGVVTLTIHSTPKTATTTADKEGKWVYAVTGLSPGSHYIEASVTDPATKLASPTAKLLAFTVTAAPKTAVSIAKPVKKSALHYATYFTIFLVVLAAVGYLAWRWWLKKQKPQASAIDSATVIGASTLKVKPKLQDKKTAFIIIASFAVVGAFILTKSFAASSGPGHDYFTIYAAYGNITSDTGEINCPAASRDPGCNTYIIPGSTIKLTRSDTDPYAPFKSWGLGTDPRLGSIQCAEASITNDPNYKGNSCTITFPNHDMSYTTGWSVLADYYQKYPITLQNSPSSQIGGTVTLNPGNFVCSTASCAAGSFGGHFAMTLTATVTNPEMAFTGWSNYSDPDITACGANLVCAFNTGDRNIGTIYANWDWKNYNVVVQFKGSGKGHVADSSIGLSCNSDCTKAVAPSTVVNITASADSGSQFTGWGLSTEGNTLCLIFTGGGKGGGGGPGAETRNTSPTCQATIYSDISSRNRTLVAVFDKAGSSPAPVSGGQSSASSSSSKSSTPNSSSPSSMPTVSSTTPSAAAAIAATASSPVQLKAILASGQPVDSGKSVEINSNQDLTLIGHTTPNALIALTLHSTPKTITTKANTTDGNWSYTFSNLTAGSHYIEASITDPTTKKVSPTAKLLSFTVKGPAVATAKAKKTNSLLIIVVVVIVAAAAAGYYWWKKKQTKSLGTTDIIKPTKQP